MLEIRKKPQMLFSNSDFNCRILRGLNFLLYAKEKLHRRGI